MKRFLGKGEGIGASAVPVLTENEEFNNSRPRSQVLQDHQKMMQRLDEIKAQNA
jgi:hypothetical protein